MKRMIWPVRALGWWAMCLGLATAAWGVILPVFPGLVRRVVGEAGMSVLPIRIPLGLGSVVVEVLLAVAAFAVGVLALRRGERSWTVLVAFVLALLVGGLWIAFALGEVIFPH